MAERIGKGDPDIQEKLYEIVLEAISEHVDLATTMAQRALDIKTKKKAPVKVSFAASDRTVKEEIIRDVALYKTKGVDKVWR